MRPNKFSSLEEAKKKIGHWVEADYNKLYVHSEVGYISPQEFESARGGSDSVGQRYWSQRK